MVEVDLVKKHQQAMPNELLELPAYQSLGLHFGATHRQIRA